MQHKNQKLHADDSDLHGRSSRKRRKSKQVAGVSARPTLRVMGYVSENDLLSTISMEFSMTIRPKITDLTQKQRSMLLAVANYRAYLVGVDFSLYLVLEYLYFTLRKVGIDPIHVKEEKLRQTLLSTELILSTVRGDWLNLGDKEELSQEVKQRLANTGWLPTDRQMQSWKQHWDLEKYLVVRIVPIEQQIHRDKLSSAERYTSYTRGYGQDGNLPAPGKTKPTPELDGDDRDPDPPEIPLLELDTYIDILNLIEGEKAAKRQH